MSLSSVPRARPLRTPRAGVKVLPEHARRHNRSLVMRTLFHGGTMSRADLARETGLTRVTISDLIGDLIDEGYVIELGTREASGPGKPAMLVDLNRERHRIVGIDLSNSDVFVGAVLTIDGDIVHRREATVEPNPDRVVDTVIQLARELIASSKIPVLGVGVATPGVVDTEGVVLTAPNFGWRDLDLRSILADALDVPVLVANDANAAVLAEYTFGGADSDVLLVRVGRGVGGGLISDGMPMRGSRSAAGEIGHVVATVDPTGGPLCACGNTGCLEAWISVPALTARIAADPDRAEAILREAGELLGIVVAPIVGALDLSEIVLAGPAELFEGPLAEAAVATIRARTLVEFHDDVRVRMTKQGPDIVLRGAVVKVLSGQLGVS